jgi:hypothetical protein
MIAAVMVSSIATSTVLLPRIGPRPLVTLGMVFSGAGMFLLTHLGVSSTYVEHVLPGLLVTGMGLGLIMAPAMNTGTVGVDASDAGVASAMVNTMQQVGGSLGTALLSTLAASATTSYLAGQRPTADMVAQATVHGYTTAFWWGVAIFAAGAVVCGLLLPSGRPQPAPAASPAPAMP